MYKFEPLCEDKFCPIKETCEHWRIHTFSSMPFESFILKDGKHPCRQGNTCNCFKAKTPKCATQYL